MTLQILVPHYHEPFEVLKPLLDSLAIQQSVDFRELGVIICSDGGDAPLDETRFKGYPFAIEYHVLEHRGVSATRNACLDLATADYVAFCDCDDMFYNACGLYIIFREINQAGGFDSLVSAFVEETRHPQTGEVLYINHDMDSTFVHGKVHRRQYLVDQGIRWDPSLTIHEDSYFNILCQNLSKDVKYCPTPFYLWKWRDDSVCRHDPLYILKTYRQMIDSNQALVESFARRGMADKVGFYVAFMVLDAYYTMNKPEWLSLEHGGYRADTERRFAAYYARYKAIWQAVSVQEKMAVSQGIRSRAVGEGMQMEQTTIDEWLRHVEETYGHERQA